MSYLVRRSAAKNGRPFRPGLGLIYGAFVMANPTQSHIKEDPDAGRFPTIALCSDNECVLAPSLEDQDTNGTSLIENWIDA